MYSSVALSTFTVLFNHHHHPPLFLNFYIERSETKCKNPVFHTCSDQDTYVESTPGGSLLPPPVHSIFKLFLLNLALCLEEKKKKSFVVLRIAQSVSQCFTPRGSSPSVLGQEGTCARTWDPLFLHSPGPPQGLKSSYW